MKFYIDKDEDDYSLSSFYFEIDGALSNKVSVNYHGYAELTVNESKYIGHLYVDKYGKEHGLIYKIENKFDNINIIHVPKQYEEKPKQVSAYTMGVWLSS